MAARARSARGGGQGVEFFTGLSRSRLLVVYLGAGFAAAGYLLLVGYGSAHLTSLVANLALLALYVAIINLATRGAARPPQPVAHPRLETALLLLYTVFLVARATHRLPEADLTGLLPAYRQIDGLVMEAAQRVLDPSGPGAEVPARLHLAIAHAFWAFLVPLLGFLAMGYTPAKLGLTLDRWWVAAPLIAVAALPWLLATAGLPVAAVPGAAGDSLAALLLVALAHEFFFRGLLLSRVEAWLGNGLNALAVVAFVYAVAQAPALLAVVGYDLTLVAAKVLMFAGAPLGLALGYLYLRTRSIAAGVLWHASPWAIFPFG